MYIVDKQPEIKCMNHIWAYKYLELSSTEVYVSSRQIKSNIAQGLTASLIIFSIQWFSAAHIHHYSKQNKQSQTGHY